MASAARAYSSATSPARREETKIRVVAGRGQSPGLPAGVVFVAKAFMIALAIFACVACVRIGLASATVTTSIETEQINEQVEDIHSGSAHLEVTESTLANPASVKAMASGQLGMAAPEQVATIVLEPDTVVYDQAGNLSLARSLGSAAVR